MRKATICVGGILCLGLAALAGVHIYESAATKHTDAAITTVPRTVNATVTPVNETRHAPRPRPLAPETLSLIRKYLVAHDTPLYNLARERLMKEIKAVERATGARLGKTCGIDGDDDDGDDDATLVRARPGGK